MAALFRKGDVSKEQIHQDIGRVAERPFQILGLTEEVTLGDLIANVVFFSTLANQFDFSRLHVKFRDVRPYSRDIMSLSPWIDQADALPGEWPGFVRHWWPQAKPWRPMTLGRLKGRKAFHYDFIATGQIASVNLVHALPEPVALKIPPARAETLREELIASGLKPDRWFAVFHYREGNYGFRPKGDDRNSEAAALQALVHHIIALGGQAVRLGHAGMTPFEPVDGFVDLCDKPNGFMLQAAAASQARFMVAGPSGAIALAWAFKIPNTLVDAVDLGGMWGEAYSNIVTHEVETPPGVRLRNAALAEAGLLDRKRLLDRMAAEPGFKTRKASAAELEAVVARLCQRTEDCRGWRQAPEPVPQPKPNFIRWPVDATYPTPWLDL